MTTAAAHFDASQDALIASGAWHVDAAAALPRLSGHTVRVLDGAAITQLDTNGAWLLLNAVRPRASDPLPELRGFQPQHLSLLNLVAQHAAVTAAEVEARQPGVLEATGLGAMALWRNFSGLVNFIGQLSIELALLIGRPGNWRWRELGAQVNAVFVGDAMTTRNVLTGESGPRPAPFTLQPQEATASIARLEAVQATWVLPGHGPPWHGGVADAIREYRRAAPGR